VVARWSGAIDIAQAQNTLRGEGQVGRRVPATAQ
jgi:hypothetical protein